VSLTVGVHSACADGTDGVRDDFGLGCYEVVFAEHCGERDSSRIDNEEVQTCIGTKRQ